MFETVARSSLDELAGAAGALAIATPERLASLERLIEAAGARTHAEAKAKG